MIKKGVVDGGKGGKERNNLVVGEKEKKLQEPGYTRYHRFVPLLS
jgi:hypothetical protein